LQYDVRKAAPYDAYDQIDFEVPVGKNCDVYDRYRCRMDEFRQSISIIKQCLDKLPDGLCCIRSPPYDMPIGKPRVMPGIPWERFFLVSW